jgi:hypothetical protein
MSDAEKQPRNEEPVQTSKGGRIGRVRSFVEKSAAVYFTLCRVTAAALRRRNQKRKD